MVGVPGRSKACLTCRRRRVSCDLQVPGCRQCEQSNRICEGYDRFPVFIVRTQTGLKKRKPMEEAKPRVSRALDVTSQPGRNDVSVSKVHMQTLHPLLLEEPALASGPYALGFFMNVIVLPIQPKHHVRALPAFLKPLIDRTASSSLLHQAVRAVSLATLAVETRSQAVQTEATQSYVWALQTMRGRYLTSSDIASVEEVLMTVSLFCLIESISADSNSSASFYSHGNGGLAFIKSRPDLLPRNAMVSHSYRGGLHLRIKECIHMCQTFELGEIDREQLDAAHILSSDKHGYSCLTRISSRIPNLRAHAVELLRRRSNSVNKAQVRKLLHKAHEVDGELLDWYQRLGESWLPHPRCPTASSLAMEHNHRIMLRERAVEDLSTDLYDAVAAFHLNEYRMFRIYTRSVILRCLQYLRRRASSLDGSVENVVQHEDREEGEEGREGDEEINKSARILQDVVDGIAIVAHSRIAYERRKLASNNGSDMRCADAATGFVLAEHVHVASCVPSICQEQRVWLEAALQELKSLYGFSHTLKFVPP